MADLHNSRSWRITQPLRWLSLQRQLLRQEGAKVRARRAAKKILRKGKRSEKLRAKTERQIQEAQERIIALHEEMAETLGEQYDPVLPSDPRLRWNG